MLYNSLNLEVAKIASKLDTKPEIAGVFFTKTKTVATDSFRLIEISVPKVKAEDYPITPQGSAMRGCDPFIVEATGLGKIKLPKNKSLPIVNNFAVKHIDKDKVEFLTTDLESTQLIQLRRIEGQFPDYEQIFPKDAPVVEVAVNAAYLSGLLDILGKLGGTNGVKMKFYGSDKPIVLEASNGDQSGRGMIMQIKI
jgi:hypothetical protein